MVIETIRKEPGKALCIRNETNPNSKYPYRETAARVLAEDFAFGSHEAPLKLIKEGRAQSQWNHTHLPPWCVWRSRLSKLRLDQVAFAG